LKYANKGINNDDSIIITKLINKYKYQGVVKSPNNKYIAIVQAHNGKEYLSIYSDLFVLMQVK
jgi:hypothetical protein